MVQIDFNKSTKKENKQLEFTSKREEFSKLKDDYNTMATALFIRIQRLRALIIEEKNKLQVMSKFKLNSLI